MILILNCKNSWGFFNGNLKSIGYIGNLCSLCFISTPFIEVNFMISWPCMLKLDGDDELIYLDSELDFMSECRELLLCEDDHVIDSVGYCYLIESISGELALIKTERILVAHDVSNLIRAHEFKKHTLCLTKIHFLTVSDAINSLSY